MFQKLYLFEKVTFPHPSNYTQKPKKFIHSKPKNILLINSENYFGGAEKHTLSLYQNLENQGNNVKILVEKSSFLEQKLKELKISYYAYNKFFIFKTTIQPGLYHAIKKICKENDIQIIHCNMHRETLAAKKAAQKCFVKVILTRHATNRVNPKYLENLDGIISVSTYVKNDLEKEIEKENLKVKKLEFIPPIFEDKKALNLKVNQTKEEFFQKNFNITLMSHPIICMIANMPKDINHKNHPLLLKAIHKLIYTKNKLVEVMLAGDGNLRSYLEKLTKELKIEKYVHFLGFTDEALQILYHSDIKVLSSRNEAFGIVIMEAALLRKPIICASNTGTANIVIHNEKTGLLFKNNNADSLVEKIEKLLDNPQLCKTLGQNVYNHVKKNFSTECIMKKITNFYEKIITN